LVSGGDIVLCAGGIASPHLLLTSGIGPADELREHGVPIVRDLPGVGKGIQDHPSIDLPFKIRDEAPLPAEIQPLQTSLHYTADDSDLVGDMQISCSAGSLNRMLRGTGGAVSRRLPSFIRRPAATLKGLRALPANVVVEQARSRNDLILLCAVAK